MPGDVLRLDVPYDDHKTVTLAIQIESRKFDHATAPNVTEIGRRDSISRENGARFPGGPTCLKDTDRIGNAGSANHDALPRPSSQEDAERVLDFHSMSEIISVEVEIPKARLHELVDLGFTFRRSPVDKLRSQLADARGRLQRIGQEACLPSEGSGTLQTDPDSEE